MYPLITDETPASDSCGAKGESFGLSVTVCTAGATGGATSVSLSEHFSKIRTAKGARDCRGSSISFNSIQVIQSFIHSFLQSVHFISFQFISPLSKPSRIPVSKTVSYVVKSPADKNGEKSSWLDLQSVVSRVKRQFFMFEL